MDSGYTDGQFPLVQRCRYVRGPLFLQTYVLCAVSTATAWSPTAGTCSTRASYGTTSCSGFQTESEEEERSPGTSLHALAAAAAVAQQHGSVSPSGSATTEGVMRRKRRARNPIPPEKKDEKYWKRRLKNNAAAQRYKSSLTIILKAELNLMRF